MNITPEHFEKVTEAGLNVFSFKDLIKNKGSKRELTLSKPDTIFTLCYTSGTTNLPKGAKLTQKFLYSNSYLYIDAGLALDNNVVHLSYLPLAHAYERIALNLIVSGGGLVCFIASNNVQKYLDEDIALTKPTYLIAVPRVLNIFHQKIMTLFNELSGEARSEVDKAIEAKREEFKRSGSYLHTTYDRTIFSKIRERYGGNIKYFLTASAPLPTGIANDLKIFFSVPIVESYGMTEIGLLTVTHFNDPQNGNTGGPLRTMTYKLADRKELNYHSETEFEGLPSPTGEIYAKGVNVFKGYFMDTEKTQETFDEEGWVKSGDIGRVLPGNKGLQIIDRVKEIFKLQQGVYLAPAKLESAYIKSKFCLQICVYGNSHHNYIIAIVVPNRSTLTSFLEKKGKLKPGDNIESFFTDSDLISAVQADFDALAKDNNFNSMEKPKKFIISPTEFTVQNEMITPTLKLCRRKIQDYFQEDINRLYL
eukprot:CAMPEP_0170516466 /NCGR_PEP_ID=MMETSP0209-20121228/2664_1 /TAXON_ID=665100 ORGANISM="Litonotus pictus, Strain P1" /NCGR_SAMPLE_ID=MMETSP0209 /ASSEMBLY_ACC=CAM_ASM_000301 /LENGTH=477 /DNA_ID=CAMNT_0010801353 /DNA_START=768 /DNA_END=2201 /DNA_ORIENTATION=+